MCNKESVGSLPTADHINKCQSEGGTAGLSFIPLTIWRRMAFIIQSRKQALVRRNGCPKK